MAVRHASQKSNIKPTRSANIDRCYRFFVLRSTERNFAKFPEENNQKKTAIIFAWRSSAVVSVLKFKFGRQRQTAASSIAVGRRKELAVPRWEAVARNSIVVTAVTELCFSPFRSLGKCVEQRTHRYGTLGRRGIGQGRHSVH